MMPSPQAVLLGAAAVLGFAPFELFPLPILALALLFRLWRRAESPRRAAWLGFCWGLGFFLAGVSWVYVSLHDVGGMAAPMALAATLGFCAWLALFPALVGYVYRRVAGVDFWHSAFLLAGLWLLAEWLRGWLFSGFPWLALGYAQTPPSPLAGYAAVLGGYGIAGLVALQAAALALAPRRRATWLLIGALLIGGQLLRGIDWTQPSGAPLQVSLLQGNIPQSLKWEPERLPQSVQTYVKLAQENPADLVVLPETAIPLFFDQLPREVRQALTQHGSALLGMAVRHRDGGYVNGAVLVGPQAAPQSYAKRHLVPFGEFVPPGFAWFFDYVRIPMSNFSAGPARQPPLQIAGQKIAPNICYEDLFGEEILAALPAATLLINLSNTAWFGDSLAQPQHLQIARLRAMETGRTMLRATNTGITAAIASDGRVLGALPSFSAGALRVAAQGFTGLTPYARWGNGLALLLAICAILPALMKAYRQRRSR
jgi:apolipoprotein N-acyltransferase